jgi:hypothetical protein
MFKKYGKLKGFAVLTALLSGTVVVPAAPASALAGGCDFSYTTWAAYAGHQVRPIDVSYGDECLVQMQQYFANAPSGPITAWNGTSYPGYPATIPAWYYGPAVNGTSTELCVEVWWTDLTTGMGMWRQFC